MVLTPTEILERKASVIHEGWTLKEHPCTHFEKKGENKSNKSREEVTR